MDLPEPLLPKGSNYALPDNFSDDRLAHRLTNDFSNGPLASTDRGANCLPHSRADSLPYSRADSLAYSRADSRSYSRADSKWIER